MAVQYLSGQLRVTGLTENGSSFEEMITKLKEVEMTKSNKLANWKLDWQERQEAFRTVRAQLQSLRSVCNELNTIDKFMTKSAASSNASVAAASATSKALAGGADEIEVGQLATGAIWSIASNAQNISDSINTSGIAQTFSYEYAGKTRTINVPPGTTLESFRNLVNNDTKNLGVQANLIRSGSSYTLQVKGSKTGSSNDMKILFTDVDGFSGGTYPPYSGKYTTSHTVGTGIVNTSTTADLTFKYTYAGQEQSVTVGPQATLQDVMGAINNDASKPAGIAASLVSENDGTFSLRLTAADGNPVTLAANSGLSGVNIAAGPVLETSGTATGWNAQASQDAKVRVNGWPQNDWIIKDSNTADDLIPNVSVTFKDIGKSTITVETDTEQITENVVKFIDAVNEFRSLIQDLTKLDSGKNTVNPEYADSLYEMQKGSILTGNYGVQLLSSQIKQATASMPKGFKALLEVDGHTTGDMYTALSQLGIKTNAEGSGGENFGLLVLNDDDRLPMLENVLRDNPMAVAEFFAAKDMGISDSENFSFSGAINSITRPGIHDVSYEINGGVIQNAVINGKQAKINADGTILLVREDPSSTDSGVVTAKTEGLADYEYDVEVTNIATHSTLLIEAEFADRADPIHTDAGEEYNFFYFFGSAVRDIAVPANATLDDLARTINRDKGNPGVTASVVATSANPPTYNLQLQAKNSGAGPALTVGMNSSMASIHGKDQPAVAGQDAVWRYRKTGTTAWTDKTTSTNQAEIAPGLNLTLRGSGTTTINALKHNDADGLSIRPDNLTDGSYSGQIRIKQGKVNELLELLNGQPGKNEEGMLGSKGALQILEDNYDHIIKGINDKLEREEARIIKWERTIRNRFARLEATLMNYENLTKTIESQLKKLSDNSK